MLDDDFEAVKVKPKRPNSTNAKPTPKKPKATETAKLDDFEAAKVKPKRPKTTNKLLNLSGGLCLQMEHHLFPTVNHCHLPAVAKIVKQACYEHGVPYTRADGYGQALAEYYRQEKKESKNLE
ncbi:hypothetical protein BJ741DRAFT_667606 [Chytriomyces cf. hyalinus JEL632]|nr:hypothetical protein BJ741DRAFT_667606 [Chytriomyces cf. hyalinus JEL632]